CARVEERGFDVW
nr:immunoglobulin heavy chain junction region [Macaca mulatta]MOW21650.1 immunoglobulin heavy chain junction region [Macaca mulatta]